MSTEINPAITVGDYLDGKASQESINEVIAIHVAMSLWRFQNPGRPRRGLYWMPKSNKRNTGTRRVAA